MKRKSLLYRSLFFDIASILPYFYVSMTIPAGYPSLNGLIFIMYINLSIVCLYKSPNGSYAKKPFNTGLCGFVAHCMQCILLYLVIWKYIL